MGVSLFTSRVILQALGVEDYGIYSVVGGFVSMFALISNSLSAAISRFITFELGKGESSRIKDVFSTAVIIQLVLALLICILLESVGVWFLNTQMTIPTERLYAANWVLQFSIITFAFNLISVPYNAAIIAHEHMGTFAFIGLFEAISKLIIVYLLYISPIDNLIFYSFLICLLSVIVRFLYQIYCRKHFVECKLYFCYDKSLIKEIFGFAGWNFIGASSGVLRDQGVNILLNIFCGPLVNAARGIAMQVSSAVQQFSLSFTTALNPQITKSFAANDRDYCFKLVFQGAKLTYILMLLISLPIILETPIILKIWLGVVPDFAVIFVQLVLMYGLSESISYTMVTLMLATGNIRNYQLLVGGCQMLNFPLSYTLLKFGVSPEYTFVVSICVAIGCLLLRLFMLNRMVALPIKRFLQSVIFKVLLVTLASILPSFIIINSIEPSLLRLITTTIVSISSVLLFALMFGCSKNERNFIISKAINIVNSKILKR
jgi:O-antigen/teichoic acid export membrane protein